MPELFLEYQAAVWRVGLQVLREAKAKVVRLWVPGAHQTYLQQIRKNGLWDSFPRFWAMTLRSFGVHGV